MSLILKCCTQPQCIGAAYWFKDYSAYLFARTFLDGIRTDYQELIDEATGDFVLLSNYTALTWQK